MNEFYSSLGMIQLILELFKVGTALIDDSNFGNFLKI